MEYITECWDYEYGVSADWEIPNDAILVLEDGGWVPDPQGRIVSDFNQDPMKALRAILEDVARGCYYDPVGDELVKRNIDQAISRVEASNGSER